LQGWWNAVDKHPVLEGNPIRAIPDYVSTVVPIWMHGDGVVTMGMGKSWQRGLNAVSFGSMIHIGDSFASSFLAWVCFYAAASYGGDGDTFNFFWEVMKWSLQALFDGEYPHCDHRGVPYVAGTAGFEKAGQKLVVLPDGSFLRGMLFCKKTDLDYQGKDLKMTHIAEVSGCAHCRATKHGHTFPWWDMRFRLAGWLPTVFKDRDSWRLAKPNKGVAIFDLLFASSHTIGVDIMHVKHLGSDRYVYGSVMWLLCYELLDGSPEENCNYVWGLVSAFCVDHEYARRKWSVYKVMKLSMFTTPRSPHAAYPALRGKAAQLHHFGPALLDVWTSHYSTVTDDPVDLHRYEQILALLRASVRMDQIVHEAPITDWVLPPVVATEYEECAFLYGELSVKIADYYEKQGRRLFNITIKTHYICHAGLMGRFLHPKLSWCYKHEDFMMYCRKMSKACAHGSRMDLVQKKIMEQHVMGKHLHMCDRDSWFR
jgi:hypothetical protein